MTVILVTAECAVLAIHRNLSISVQIAAEKCFIILT